MVCWATLRDRAASLGLKVVDALVTDKEIQDVIGAESHAEAHEIIDGLTDREIVELITKILERAQKKRAAANRKSVATQGVA